MEITFGPEDEAFRQEVRAWLEEHLVGQYRDYLGVGGPADDVAWDVRVAWERELAGAKLLSISWPREYGGRGGTLTQEYIFVVEHFKARAPYWAGVHGRDLFGPTLLRFGSTDLKARFLPPITRAEEFWGQGFSEPDAGSDLAGLKTRAERRGDQWVINGQKIWMSFGRRADWMYVLCRTDAAAPKHKGLSLLLVPAHQPGVDVRPIRNMTGEAEFAEAFFTDAHTDAGMVVGDVNGGWAVVMEALSTERAGTVVVPYQLKFEQEMERLLALAKARGLGADPVMRDRLSHAWIGLQVLRYGNLRLLEAQLAGRSLGSEASTTKLFWANWHQQFGNLMVDVAGPDAMIVKPGYQLDLWQRSFISSRAETIYGGSNEVQRSIVGERVLGLPREPRVVG